MKILSVLIPGCLLLVEACASGPVPSVLGQSRPPTFKTSDPPNFGQSRPDVVPEVAIERVPTGYLPERRGPGVPAFWVRPGYRVDLVARNIGETRFMEFDNFGTLYVAQPNAGTIKMLKLQGGEYVDAGNFVSGYKSVHGLDFKDGWMWFTTSGAVFKAEVSSTPTPAATVATILDGLPNGGHWWRSIFVVDDGFFTSIGDAGNITDLTLSDREKIWKYSLDGKTRTLWSSGIRNTEKLRFKPGTQELYGCDQGSDNFGGKLGETQGRNQPVTDYNPPDEFNKYVEGGFYGHPFIVGNRVPRYEYMDRPDILELANKTIPPIWAFGAHWAADGWNFIWHSQLGSDFDGDAVVALHGSWNRTVKAGYRIERVLFDKVIKEPYGSQLLVGALDPDNNVLARPVDVVQAPDGTLLFSEDSQGRIFRFSRVKK
jgi:glucose/arabinose dehydrogenase